MHTREHNSLAMAVRERCRTLGIPSVRCDSAGALHIAPDDEPFAFVLRSPWLSEAIQKAAIAWNADPAPPVIEPDAGFYLVPVPEGTTKARRGYTIALVFGEPWLKGQIFSGLCADAGACVPKSVGSMGIRAGHNRTSAELLRASLRWMIDDIARSADQTTAVGELTAQLTDSYETLDSLYAIGKSMRGLAGPATFIESSVQRVHASLRFETVFILLAKDEQLTAALQGRAFIAGRRPEGIEQVDQWGPEVLLDGAASGFRIIANDPRLVCPDHPEALIVPLSRGTIAVGALVGMHKSGGDTAISSYDIQLMESTAGFISAFLDNVAVYEEQRLLFLGTVQALTAAIDAKDRYTHGHSERVAHLSARLAEASGMSPEEVHRVWIAGLVHDVGKIGVPEAVLCKQGRLTDEEFDHIKKHPQIGHHILKDIRPLADVLPGVLHHHEKFDGRGYPAKLIGDDIPRLARIIALADTFDAMSSTRSYRPAMPRDKVLEEIRRCAGTQFDPELAARFVLLDFSEFDAMVERSRAAEAWANAA